MPPERPERAMSLAAKARTAVEQRPFLFQALRAGVVNYSAAARGLDLDEDEAAVATALRRYAQQLPEKTVSARRATVTMQSGLEPGADGEGLLAVNGSGFTVGNGDLTAVVATGDLDPTALRHVLGRLDTAGIGLTAAGVVDGGLCIVVKRREGPRTVEVVEGALDAVPDPTV